MFIGIDLGTSSIKTVLIDEKQKMISQASCKLDLNNPQSGYYEQDPEDWFISTKKCFNILKNAFPKEFKSTEAIGISGQMHGATLINNNNDVLRPCILWNDTRSVLECLEMEKKYPFLRKESGNIAMPGFTSPKILWIKKNEPEIFKKIFKVLLPKDYLRFRLTNLYFTDMSDASGTLWLNVKDRKWSEELLNLTDLKISNMPSLLEGNKSSGILSEKIKNEFGFEKKVIVAGGAGDQAAGAIGSGVIKFDQSMISLGTSGVCFSPTNSFSPKTDQAVHSFCHCLPNTWHHMSVMLSATSCLSWISNIHKLKVNESIKKAESFFNKKEELILSPFFLPYLSGERTPHNNSYLRGSFHVINTSSSLESLLYSVIEGISFGIKDGFDAVNNIDKNSKKIYLVGGGSKSQFWGNLIATILNKNIEIGKDSDFSPALGVARLAMLATEKYNESEVVKNMETLKECKPINQYSDILKKRYNKWKTIVNTNKLISKKIIE